jgi:hypothetical protein
MARCAIAHAQKLGPLKRFALCGNALLLRRN